MVTNGLLHFAGIKLTIQANIQLFSAEQFQKLFQKEIWNWKKIFHDGPLREVCSGSTYPLRIAKI